MAQYMLDPELAFRSLYANSLRNSPMKTLFSKNVFLSALIFLFALMSFSTSAIAAVIPDHDQFLFQWEDAGNVLTGNTFKNGVLIQSAVVGTDSYPGNYFLTWNANGTLMSNVNVSFNFYDTNNVLGQTWQFNGVAGDNFLGIPFDSSAAVAAIAGGTNIIYTGGYFTALEFDLSNGDHYIWQFRSQVAEVPEPGTYALMFAGLCLISFFALRRKV